MKHNIVVLFCSVVLAILIGVSVNAITTGVDTDGDGFADGRDNCETIFNYEQNDTDGDGYGVVCDLDFDQSGKVDNSDYATFQLTYGLLPTSTADDCTAPETPFGCCTGVDTWTCVYEDDADLNCDGKINTTDYSTFQSQFYDPVGPGADCAPSSCGDTPTCADYSEEDSLQINVADGFGLNKNESGTVPVQMWIPDGWAFGYGDICEINFAFDQSARLSVNNCDGTEIDCSSIVSDSLTDWDCECNRSGSSPNFSWAFTMTKGTGDCVTSNDDFDTFVDILDVSWLMKILSTGDALIDWDISFKSVKDDSDPQVTLPNVQFGQQEIYILCDNC